MPFTPGISRGWASVALLGVLAITGCGPRLGPIGVEYTPRRPPPYRAEVRDRQPDPRSVWVPGHYAWRSGDYVWMSGRWEAPPQPTFRRWEPGHWVSSRQGWYWVEGRWR